MKTGIKLGKVRLVAFKFLHELSPMALKLVYIKGDNPIFSQYLFVSMHKIG